MPQRLSNSDRIAKAAAEAEAKAKAKAEKAAARAAKPPKPRKPREPPPPQRLKIVWSVGEPGGPPVKTFPYPERAAADAEASRAGKHWIVKPIKVPME